MYLQFIGSKLLCVSSGHSNCLFGLSTFQQRYTFLVMLPTSLCLTYYSDSPPPYYSDIVLSFVVFTLHTQNHLSHLLNLLLSVNLSYLTACYAATMWKTLFFHEWKLDWKNEPGKFNSGNKKWQCSVVRHGLFGPAILQEKKHYSHCLESIDAGIEDLSNDLTAHNFTMLKNRGKTSVPFLKHYCSNEDGWESHRWKGSVFSPNAFIDIPFCLRIDKLPRVGCDFHYYKTMTNLFFNYMLTRFTFIAKQKSTSYYRTNIWILSCSKCSSASIFIYS